MISNKHALKAAVREARDRSGRRRVCMGCIDAERDRPLGVVHSECACQRCGVAPCFGVIVEPLPAARGRVAAA